MLSCVGDLEQIQLLFKSTVRRAEQLTKALLPLGNRQVEQWDSWMGPVTLSPLLTVLAF